ncbi:TMED7-TICAM2 readthrough [Homo sapiens]|nr:TRAM adaptor with GOLD domain isoform 1 precursor [Homo sapiens]AAQ97430.1 TIRAP3b long form [Homo sapiens]AAQ97433.1 TIRAP3b [Homo sapiens]EAW48961.1 hCG37564, isoform CRA_c [Homo sapiens]KAI2538495.1 TMED7-TICAM2 readthrough [Homo sapiens]KAI4022268.1 TMED7-TICAM2 readthrough [Homo sapiens]|eukprot:NP_001157940.1 TRAM adaptor with GOLD domain isoform 1 precursor [Homo sapiens]
MPRPGSAQRWAAVAGRWGCRLLALLLLVPGPGGASEITFELPDNAKQCFYEDIAQGTKCTLEFQVITGGHYDVDCRLEDPDGKVLYKEMKKQYDSFTFTASKNGTYKFCFSNEFSTFTHKTVYFDFQVGEDPPLFPSENRVSALTQMESACVSIHEALKSVIDYQTHFRLREAQGRSRAEDLNTRVAYWHSVDTSPGYHESDSKKSEDLSLCNVAEHSNTTEGPTGKQEGAQSVEEMFEEEAEEEVFLKFVILHAEDDTDEALRVQNLLQDDFGIKPGIIFAEMPCGRQHLQNLDDAVNGSAWTILLLTENFLRDTWCNFQFYTSLMNSVNRQHKYNSVIPMRPLNNPLPRERTPFALQTINALEEESRGFPTQVERIFQESVYKTQQTIWKETRNMVQRQFIA